MHSRPGGRNPTNKRSYYLAGLGDIKEQTATTRPRIPEPTPAEGVAAKNATKVPIVASAYSCLIVVRPPPM